MIAHGRRRCEFFFRPVGGIITDAVVRPRLSDWLLMRHTPRKRQGARLGCCGTPATGQAPGGEAARPDLAWLPARTKSTGRRSRSAGAAGVDADRRYRADEKLHEDGTIYFNLSELEQIARELDVPDTIGRHVLRQLDGNFLLTSENGHFYKGEVALALRYEDRFDRAQLWRRNGLRREDYVERHSRSSARRSELDYHEDGGAVPRRALPMKSHSCEVLLRTNPNRRERLRGG